jgi:lipopolysaccharide export system protein LptC
MHEMADASFVGGGSDREHAFRAAIRHSRVVRFYRRAIPVGLVAVMGTIAAAAYFKPLKILSTLQIDPARTVVTGTKINMEMPKLGGFTRDGRPYELTASGAAQDLTNPGVLELKDVRAKIEMQDKNTVDVVAATGVYDTKGDAIVLKTDVVVTSSAGYSVRMNEAEIDVKTNHMMSDKSVLVTLSNGTIKAKRMDVSENGDLMRFTGDVETYFVPQTAEPAATEGAASAASAAPAAGPKTRQ